MADDSQAKSDFGGILSSMERKFDLIHTKWSGDARGFEAKFRTQIPRDSDDFNALCDQWVERFSKATGTVWVNKISNTGPKIRFRKQYQCWPQKSSDNVCKELLFDSRRCKATLDVKVLTDNPLTRRKNKHIRLGLNVVVKMNFTHLHQVDTSKSFAWFIHTCEPQAEPPRPVAPVSSEKLSQKVAEMVQKGLSASPKVVNLNPPEPVKEEKKYSGRAAATAAAMVTAVTTATMAPPPTTTQMLLHPVIDTTPTLPSSLVSYLQPTTTLAADVVSSAVGQHHHLPLISMDPLALVPVHNDGEIKLEVQPQLHQLTQVVVTGPQLDLGGGGAAEPLLMSCQPTTTLMFDPTQVIPVTAHAIPHHFVQVHPGGGGLSHHQNGHYL